jgi:pimeloyl-ACP methyl ester carboxylesterase
VTSTVLGMLLLITPAFGQTKGSNTANSDPVVCFDDVLRDAENALQAYSIALTKSWTQEVDCRRQAPSAPELASCWDLLLEARPLISQAGNLNEQARRMRSPEDADRLSQQAGALMRQAADLVRKARDCFKPVFAQWQKNGGRYIAKRGTSDSSSGESSGASSEPQVPPSLPPIGRAEPGQRRPAASQPTPSEPGNASSPVTLSVRIAAHKAADTIAAGNDSRAALAELNKAQRALPPNAPRPIQCWGMMVDAASKRNVQPEYAIPQAQRAAACYDGQDVAVSGPPSRLPQRLPVCDLERLAAIVFQQYGPTKPPIGIYSVANRPGTYLIALQGLEPGVVEGYDVLQAWLSGTRNPELALAYNARKAAHGDDQYRTAILDAVKALPRGSKLILAGHSAGGIEAQNLVSDLTRLGYRVERVITFGSPITADKAPSTQYTYVKSQGDPVAWLDQRYEFADTLLIPPGPNANPFAENGSHSFYWFSQELARKSPDFFDTCLDLVFYSSHGLPGAEQTGGKQVPIKATEPSLPCATADFSRKQALNTFDPWSANPSWTRAFASAWWDARTSAEEAKISERMGEAGMTQAVRVLRYTTLLSPGQASQRPQGFDAVYRDRDGTLVIADAKGSVPASLNSVMKYGYNCRQGTMGWAWRAAEATFTSGASNSDEKRIAESIMDSIRKGDRIRIEVFLTEHVHGVPRITKQFVTASYP